MLIKKKYTVYEMAWWTRYETLLFIFISSFWVSMYYFFDITWFKIPWTPLGLIGTAVAFVIGFQNNAAYERIWEARKIWGAIVNTSRVFGMFIQSMINNDCTPEHVKDEIIQKEIKILTYRHIAWMTALRHSMRTKKPWETYMDSRTNREWDGRPPETDAILEEDLKPYISDKDFDYLRSKSNKQTALLYLQSHHLKELKEQGLIEPFTSLTLAKVLQDLFDCQGKSERIKNFPYPRQFATLNQSFMWIFILLLPLALAPQFLEIGAEVMDKSPLIGKLFVWCTIPLYVIVAWIFHTMERIGRNCENPFEGAANDVPISTIARGIEIDLRQNLGEINDKIPKQFEVKNHTQF